MKKCPRCKEDINKGATKCPKCQADLRSWSRRHPILATIVFCFLFTAFIQALVDNNAMRSTVALENTPVNTKLQEARKNIVIHGYVRDDTYPHAVLDITNNTKHTIDLFAFTANLFNNADEMQYEQISGDDYFGGQSQELIPPGKTVSWEWQLSLFPHATKIGNIKIIKVHYKDTNETVE